MTIPRTITLAAVAMLSVAGCKKQPTTSPDGATAVEADDEDEADEDEADEDEADEADAPASLNKANFDETINDHFSEVSDCYIAALEQSPELAGKLVADFTIGTDGQVAVATAEGSTIVDEGLVACIGAAASSWGFATPAGVGMTLRYTFNLAPAG